jgi:hypothetical protein
MSLTRVCTLLAATLVLAAAPARGANIVVPPGDSAQLVAAFTTANGNGEDDTIVLGAGSTYALTAPAIGVNGLPAVTGKITVQGNGATIARTGGPEFRILDVAGTGDLTLDRVTVKGGRVTFNFPQPNFSDGGAGIRVLGAGKLTLTNSTVTQNQCLGDVCQGGGILAFDNAFPVVTLTDSTVSESFAQTGGGISLRHNDQILRLTRTTITGNTGITGGGIATNGHDQVTIVDSIIHGNSVSELVPGGALGGGILDIGGASWTISGTTISGNTVTANINGSFTGAYGGGMGENGGATITMVNSTVTGNSCTNNGTALVAGGGLFSEGGGTWSLRNVTIAGNTVTGQNGSGGGLETTRGTYTLRNSIVSGNSAGSKPDCSAAGNMLASVLSEGHNLVGSTTGCGGFVLGAGDLVGQDPQLGALADNTGPTPTMALPPGSPAVDAGDPAAPGTGTGCEPADQRGVARPQGAACDIGAFELGVSTVTTTTLPGCAAVPTFESIDCRLDLLVALVEQGQGLRNLKTRLLRAVKNARTRKKKAEGLAAAGRRRPAKRELKKAVRQMVTFLQTARSRTGRRVIEGQIRMTLIDRGSPILTDMKSLLATL